MNGGERGIHDMLGLQENKSPSTMQQTNLRGSEKDKIIQIHKEKFTTYGAPKPPSRTSEPVGLTHEDRLKLPTGPRERTAEELDRNRLGGGFRSFDRINRGGGGGDDSNSRWGSSRGSDRNGGGGFGRESNRDLGPSRADEVDNWAMAKKPSVVGNGFERRERDRDRDRGGFFDSQSKADESESWVANKSFTPSEGRRFGGGDRERRGGGFTSNGGGADSDFWGKKREDSNGGIGNESESGSGRRRLNLQPRTLPINNATSPGSGTPPAAKPKGANPFGEARPREEVLAEKGQDWKKIDEQLDSRKIKEATERAEGGSSSGKKSFGIGNGRSGDLTEMSWRKPDTAEDAASYESAEKVEEEGPTEEN
ncbi:hypothetical protein TIFTF001_017852 [Ficus carica]|uniref:Uncharacterized protein n=1 Tax=Ficus carica TaxID=3494 RepID=A0AA88AUW5_FICCA|nr:hypothetical protein TIFTF001_017852 [Ficus carica]